MNEEQNILIIEGGQDELQPRVVAAQRKHKKFGEQIHFTDWVRAVFEG